MRSSLFASWPTKSAVLIVAAILVLMPFHATITVFLSQFVGHYTLLRLWKEALLVPLTGYVVYVGITQPAIRRQALRNKLFWLIAAFIAVQIVWGAVAVVGGQVTPEALGYGWIVDTRFLIFFVVVWVVALMSPKLVRWWPYLVFVPALIVAVFGLLQYFVLPYDVMKHLGYGATTIFPYEDINHNIHYIRIMSSLRGANPLGAYLVLAITLFTVWAAGRLTAARRRSYKQLAAFTLYAAMCVLALLLTFSRGAWLGLAASLIVLVWSVRRRLPLRLVAVVAVALGLLLAGFGVLTFVVRNPAVQNIVLHTEDHSAIASTSNEGHSSALQTGLNDLLHEPLGRGPGTAGPASEYNTGHPLRIAENYFVQIGQETGWLGLLLFIAILGGLMRSFYCGRGHLLATGLLAALAGLTVVCLTSHAWADDTLAYIFWGLAGIAYASYTTSKKKQQVD